MPSDFRIILGFTDPDTIARAAKYFGFHAQDEDYEPLEDPEGEIFGYDLSNEASANLRPHLDAAYAATIKKIGGDIDITDLGWRGSSASVILDGETYQATPFSIAYYFDEDECGDQPGDGVFGVALDGRYNPVLLDLNQRDIYGSTRDLDAYAPRIQAAREALTEEFPIFAQAHLIIKAVFY